MKPRRLRDVLLILFITLGLLLLLEVVMRTAGYAPAAPLMSEWMKPDPVLLWKNKPNAHGTRGSRFAPTISYLHNAQGFRMRDAVQPKAPDAFRVLMMGDSNIWGFGLEQSQTLSAILQKRFLSRMDNDRPIEVLNLGVTGYSSYQGMKLLQPALYLQPDLIVFAYGYNDRRYVASIEQQDGEAYFRKTYFSVKMHQWLFGYSALTGGLFAQSRQPIQTTLGEAAPRVSAASYQRHFDAMLKLCRQEGIPAVVLGLRDNPATVRRIEQARLYEEQERYGQAATEYFRILNAPNLTESSLVPYLLYRLVQEYPDEVLEAVQRETELQVTPQRLQADLVNTFLPVDSLMGMTVIRGDWEYLAVLAKVCSKYEEAVYLDYQEVIASLSDEERLRCYFSIDPCHMTVTGQTRLAEALEPILFNHYLKSRSEP